jgi:hypothetical protein
MFVFSTQPYDLYSPLLPLSLYLWFTTLEYIQSGDCRFLACMEKSALAGEGGGYLPTPFQPITITYKVEVYAPAE